MPESTATSPSPPTINPESEFHIAHISLPMQDWMSTWEHTAEAEAAGVGVGVPRHHIRSASPEMLPVPPFDIDDFDLDPCSWDRAAGAVNYRVATANTTTTTSTTHIHTHTPTTTSPNDATPAPATISFITSPTAAPAATPSPRRFPPPPLLPHLRKLVRLHGCIRGSSRTIRILQELWLPSLPPAVLLSLGFESTPNTNPNPDDDLEKGEAVAQMVAGWVVRHGKRLFSGSKERAEADRRWEAWCEGMLAGRGKNEGGAEGDDTVDEEEGSTPPPPPPHPHPANSAPAAHQPQHPPLHPHPHLHTYDLNTSTNTPIHAVQQAQQPYPNPNPIMGFEAAAMEEKKEKYPYLIVVRGERPGLEWGRYQIMGCMRL